VSSTETSRIMRGHPTLEEYCRHLDFNPQDLSGKRVLDLGCDTGMFADDCKDAELGAFIVSLDPNVLHEIMGGWYSMQADVYKERNFAVGAAPNLPFRDGTFDIVLSLFAVPWLHVFSYDEAELVLPTIRDIARILAPDGEARILPAGLANLDSYSDSPGGRSMLAKDVEFMELVDSALQTLTTSVHATRTPVRVVRHLADTSEATLSLLRLTKQEVQL